MDTEDLAGLLSPPGVLLGMEHTASNLRAGRPRCLPMPPPSPFQPGPTAARREGGDDAPPVPAPAITHALDAGAGLALHPVGVSAAFLRRLAHDLETSQAFGTVKCHRNIQCSDCGVTPVIGGLHHGEEAWRHEATDAVDEDSGARPPPRRVVTEAGLDLCDACFAELPESDQSAFVAVSDCAELGIYKGGLTQEISNLPAATTADAYSKFLRPRADAAGARGYHLAAGLDGEVGPATVHVVHAHDRPVLELIDTLLTVAADGPDAEAPKDFPNNETFFHVDVLVNVVPDPGGPPDDRCAVAAAGIAAVGRTLVVSSPWDRPAWTAEARCLFEAYAGLRTVARTPPAAVSANRRVGTSTSTGVAACRGGSSTMAGSVEFLLPDPERAAFRSAVTADFDVLADEMIRIDLQTAIAPEHGLPGERESIDAAVREVEGGAARLNYELGVALRDWVFRLLVELVEEDEADLAAAVAVPEPDRIDFAKLCYNAGSILADNDPRALFGDGGGVGDSHDVAVSLCEKAAAAFEAVLGPDHVDTAKSLANAADMHDRLGDPDRALELYGRVLKIEEAVAGPGHPSTAATHECLGVLHSKVGDHAQALKHHTAALQMYEDVIAAEGGDGDGGGENDGGAVDLMAAKSHSHLGLIYLGLDDADNAMAHYLEGVRIFEAELGEGHVNTADCYAGVAAVHYAAGEHETALEFFLQSLVVYELELGEEDLKTAAMCNKLATVMTSMTEHDHALEYSFRALRVQGELLGPQHPDLAATYTAIGEIYFYGKQDAATALEYHNEALTVFTATVGPDAPEMGRCFTNLGNAAHATGDLDQALRYLLRGLRVYQQTYGQNHPAVAVSQTNLANVYTSKGNTEQAEQCLQRATAIHAYLAPTMNVNPDR